MNLAAYRTGYRLGDVHLELGSLKLASSEYRRELPALVS
jgi:hypothetical protein